MIDFKNFLIGIILGISNIIPGVSAGTMAVTLGIYDKLIDSVLKNFRNFRKNFKFLFFVGLGVLFGIIAFSSIMEKLLIYYPWEMNYLFTGLILGGMGVLFKEVKKHPVKKMDYLYLLITFLILVFMSFVKPEGNMKILSTIDLKNLIYLFLSGFIASSAMVVPGISGSFILILFGMYNSIISAVSNFKFSILIPFGVGVLFGLVITIKIIGYLLERFKIQTYMCIIGLVIGSIFSIFPGFEFSIIGAKCVIMLLIGILISYYVSKI